jgi:hypothetical protein
MCTDEPYLQNTNTLGNVVDDDKVNRLKLIFTL